MQHTGRLPTAKLRGYSGLVKFFTKFLVKNCLYW